MSDPVTYCDDILVIRAAKDDGVILDFKYPSDETGRVRESYVRIYLSRPVFDGFKNTIEELKKTD